MIYLDVTLEKFFEDKPNMKRRVIEFCKENNYEFSKIQPIVTQKSFGVLIDPPREAPFFGTPRDENFKKLLASFNPCT